MGLAGWGALAGLGRGVADVSRQNEQERLQQERLDASNSRNQDTLDLRRELQQMKIDAATGKAAGNKGSGALNALDLAGMGDDTTTRLRTLGGMDAGEAGDLALLERGKTPTRDVDLPPDRFSNPDRQDDAAASGVNGARVAKYTSGESAKVAQRGYDALLNAMGLAKPEAVDDIEKSRTTRRQRELSDEYVATGSERAGSGALLLDGKPINDDGTNKVSGKATEGSLDAARIKTEGTKQVADGALANKRNADAAKEKAGGSGAKVKSSYVDASGDRIQLLTDGTEKNLGKDKTYQSMLSREMADIRKSMDGVGKSADEVEEMAVNRIARRAGKPTEKPAAASAPKADAPKAGSVAEPKTKAEYDALPAGALYRKDGVTKRKGG